MSTGRPRGAKNKTPEERELERQRHLEAIEERRKKRKETPRGKLGKAYLLTKEAGETGLQASTIADALDVSLEHARIILSELAARGFVTRSPVTYRAK